MPGTNPPGHGAHLKMAAAHMRWPAVFGAPDTIWLYYLGTGGYFCFFTVYHCFGTVWLYYFEFHLCEHFNGISFGYNTFMWALYIGIFPALHNGITEALHITRICALCGIISDTIIVIVLPFIIS